MFRQVASAETPYAQKPDVWWVADRLVLGAIYNQKGVGYPRMLCMARCCHLPFPLLTTPAGPTAKSVLTCFVHEVTTINKQEIIPAASNQMTERKFRYAWL
jgi:hypothetical protein